MLKRKLKFDLSKNTIVCGDNQDWLQQLFDQHGECVDLCYIDPPFYSQKTYEVIWGNSFEKRSFDDRFLGDVNYFAHKWLKPKIDLIKKVLKPKGSIFVHCDWHANYKIRDVLEDVFEGNFINELIWHYPDNFQGNINGFSRNHDTIYWYSKSEKLCFNKIKIPLDKPVKRDVRVWDKTSKKVVSKRNEDGSIIYKMYKDKSLDSVWVKGQSCVTKKRSKERIGYETQKPESILKYIISCASNEGELVLDCFAGGGTTAKVSHDLKRKFITGDVSPVACRVTAERFKCKNECKI